MRLRPLKHLKAKLRLRFHDSVEFAALDWEVEAISDRHLLFVGDDSCEWDAELPQKIHSIELSLRVSGTWKTYVLQNLSICRDERGVIPRTLSFEFHSPKEREDVTTHLQLAETAA